MLEQTALYRIGDTKCMHPYFCFIPYTLPPQLATTRHALDTLEVLDADGVHWVPAYPLIVAETESLMLAEARTVSHQNLIFEPSMQSGLAVLMDLTSTSEFANGLGPDNRR